VAAQHETRIERFRELDKRLLRLASRLVRARLASGIPSVQARQTNPEYTLLSHELAKKQRHLPVRQLIGRMPQALRRLTPCLMMSPLSVAQYLPADASPFDLVIFDEASQIPTWDAIGAWTERARYDGNQITRRIRESIRSGRGRATTSARMGFALTDRSFRLSHRLGSRKSGSARRVSGRH
jgi:hypothetical protein